ncbi:A-kinase anchor protein 13 isoform X3 [Hemicordylus capensis]|uniref:A-kinase anchor protein 13 isoform X3 n=1 Tax=Hemicordylus capensis TaxID=884348 RepID=UPI0023021369|nr:A-kinase anchor protein 13 isoform X3 [Hemicordylus capensis]XP_053128084.1 A-kinase anchor protein 13 isoform X3 [Hemicordylus capensis]XP_053128085.1 A-kinase anchor protein 13 isoform X3 [Hemicordylus capensis]
MKLNPQQAPLYGDCTITVLLTEDDRVENEDDVVFYLVFSGSSLQHCASTRKLDSVTLETIAPGHDCCETVKVSLCATKHGHPLLVVAEDSFRFVQDEAYDAAQFLATCAGNQQALNFTRFLDRSRPPAGDVDSLDEKVALAFRHLKLPAEWNVLGADHTLNEHVPRETLMHFAVRLGLLRLSWFLLQQPGGKGSLCVPNSEGATPVSLALERGYQKLHQLLTEEGASEPDSWSTLSHTVHSGEYCVKYHRGLDVYVLTAEMKERMAASVESDIGRLQAHVQSQQHMNANEHPLPERSPSREACCASGGATTAASHKREEMTAEGSPGEASPALDLDAMQLSLPGCPQEDGCGHLKELSETPKEPPSPEDAENPTSSCQSSSRAELHKGEGEELPSAAASGAILEEDGGGLNRAVGLHRASSLPPCAVASEGAGMTSPRATQEPGDLCEGNPFQQEVRAAVEQAAEPAPEPPAPRQDGSAGMGQTECKSCTGTGEAPGATTGPQCVENGACDSGPTGTAAVGGLPADPAAALPGAAGDGVGTCGGEGVALKPAADPCNFAPVDANGKAGTDAPGGGSEGRFAAPSEHRQGAAFCPGTEPVAAQMANVAEAPPECGPVLEVQHNGERVGDGKRAPLGAKRLDWSNNVQDAGANFAEDRPSQKLVEPEASAAGDETTETVAEVQETPRTLEAVPWRTEPASHACGGSAVEACHAPGGGAEKGAQSRGSGLCTVPAGASAPCPGALGPEGSSSAGEEPPCKEGERTESRPPPLDRFSRSAQEFIAAASALLVEEAIQQAQVIVAQGSGGRAAPSGQEAPLQPEDLALASRGKGTELVQDNLAGGTPSAGHDTESKQNQEVAAAAAAELPAVAEQGSPVWDELALEAISPADRPGKNTESSSSPQLPGKETALSEGRASAAVAQALSCPGSAQVGIEGEASSLEAGEDVKVSTAAAGGVLQQPGLAEGPPCADAMLNQELECQPDWDAASPASSALREAPPADRELASLPQEGEEVGIGAPSRLSLQPIAEEQPCDGDSGSEVFFLASEGETCPGVNAAHLGTLAWPSGGEGEAQPELQILPPGPPPEWLGKVEAGDSVQAASGISVGHTAKVAENPSRAALVVDVHGPSELLAGNPMEIPPVTEPGSDDQLEADAGSVPNGEMDLRLESGGRMEATASQEVASPASVAEAVEMKTEEEVGCARGLAENAEGTINRESWSPMEPSPDPSLLEPKRPFGCAERDNFLEDGLSRNCTSSRDILKRGSGSESDLFPLPGDGMDDLDFGKQPEEEQSTGDSMSSSSSADDTISLERNSSLGSNISLPQALGLSSRPKDQSSPDGSCSHMTSAEGQDGEAAVSGELEEELDSITEVPPHSSVLRNSMRPLSPFRRHSWGPGKNASNEAEINHRSSMRMLGEGGRKPPTHRRSLSWCPLGVHSTAMGADMNGRSYSLEGLAREADGAKKPSSGLETESLNTKDLQQSPLANDERGSLVSLTEEELESEQGELRGFGRQIRQRSQPRAFSFTANPVSPPLTKSMSLMAIAQPGPDTQGRTRPSRRISFSFSISPLIPKSKTVFSIGSSSSDEEEELASSRFFIGGSLAQSINEESGQFLPPSPSRKDLEGKSGTKVSRTFSYLKNKMSSSKKSKEKEKDKEKTKEKDKDSKEKDKDKKAINGHLFSTIPTVGPINCYHCMKPFNKDSVACATCGILIHKSCKESVTACAKVKMKLQKGGLQPHDTSSLPTVVMRSKSSQPKERPRSAILAPDEITVTSLFNNRRSQQNPALSKSVSIQNIAGAGNDESALHTWKFLSQSTDSLNKISRVNESMESLTDEGADMNEGQLMGDFETDSKQLEAQSWSQVVDSKFLRQQKKDVVKRQDVIYELMQTEMHHVRTLKIMSDVYSRGMLQELQYEQSMVEKVFPCLDDLLNIHSLFFQRILERKKESLADRSEKNFVIRRIGDILVNQFSGENAERMKKTYGKFCGHHNEAVNYFKDLHSKEKRFQAFIKKKMSSAVVRRLGIPECILLVTQRITKYPVLLQRILQYTKESDDEHQDLMMSLNLVKEVITAVNSKVSNYEKKMRLDEIYTRTESKSIMRMKSGQMFAREDLRRRKFVRDGPVSLRNATGRLKEVQAVLLSDVLIFLQEKDQKYAFASLDQRSTVISLKKLIVREVAHEEKGLFLISMVGKDPEMVEVHASSKEERSSWIHTIQDTINTMDKEEDEGIPSESEEEKRVLDTKARELKEQLQQKDQQIITLLEEKEKIFRDMTDCSGQEDSTGARTLFRANTEEAPKGESVMKNVISEVELLQGLVSRSLGSALGPPMCTLAPEQEAVGPVSLPRRAETFGGFDSHQMSVGKGGERDDAEDLRRTESDSVLKKGGTAHLMFVLKRNNEQVLQSITNLHSLLSKLQAVVVQQDTFIEDQKLLLTERALSRSSLRPNSLIEQEKQRSLEKQRQELANLQKQQAQHQEEKRRREREWEARERELAEREAQLARREEQAQKGLQGLEKEREELQQRKAAYQLDLEQLRAAQKQLEKEKEQLRRDMEQIPHLRGEPSLGTLSNQHVRMARTPSLPASEDPSSRPLGSSLSKGHLDTELSPASKRNSLSRTHKEKGAFHLLGTTTSNQSNKPAEGHSQAPNRLFGLAKPKEKKEKKKKAKGHRAQPADAHSPEAAPEGEEIFC